MINAYKRNHNVVLRLPSLRSLRNLTDIIWIDLHNPEIKEVGGVEKKFKVNIPSRLQQEEIESSSRYIEKDDYIVVNSKFLQKSGAHHYKNVNVSFILKGDVLITYRESNVKAFDECIKRIENNTRQFSNGNNIFIALFETRIDFDADYLENISRHITEISKELSKEEGPDSELLKEITEYQEVTMQIRENIIDKQRVVSSIIKNLDFAEEEKERLRILIKDIDSLVDHINFLFERLEYLQNTFLGLVNIEQNKIIKIFTVVSVIIMPPTLIASMYGMNFRFMPELNWKIGYPLAIAMMLGSSLITWIIFKRHKWL
jgi:magnesium transporter